MIGALFSFRGRINRIQYFLTSLGLFIAPMVGTKTLESARTGLQPDGGARLLIVLFIVLVGLIAGLWIGLSAEVRRLRDIGWEPLIVIPAWIFMCTFDVVLAQAFPFLSVTKSEASFHSTIVSLLGNLALMGCLFFWPSKTDTKPVLAGEPQPTRRSPSQFATQFSSSSRGSAFISVSTTTISANFWIMAALIFATVFLTALIVITQVN